MPELPEVETTLRGVSPHLVGRTIVDVDIRERRLRWPIPPQVDHIAGQRIVAATRRGKYLLFTLGDDNDNDATLILHLGMSGSLRIVASDAAEWRRHDHVALRLDNGRELRLHDPRRFGCLLFCQGNPLDHPLLAPLGPEPLTGDAFSAAYLAAAAKGKKLAIKSLIMNSHVVVGVGNIYACEALFLAGIHPQRAAGRISKARLEGLVNAIREVLGAAIEMGGTTLRDFVNEKGEPGYFKQQLTVYDREGQPCRVCCASIKRIVQTQRSTFFCPRCQR